MAVTWKAVNNALAIYDADYPHRWYDAFGAGVVKYLQDFATLIAQFPMAPRSSGVRMALGASSITFWCLR